MDMQALQACLWCEIEFRIAHYMALGSLSLALVVAFSMNSFNGESFEWLHVNCSDGSDD